ncbi:hypothetical protein [Streptomyces sp. HUAS TT20]|uniref:hypothetical protein n=1 Tax=Streptomyces sp. HUAS TT20 TaxID=3447509 RepID=UPI0021DACB58|nr:hypothetical protein [Streptomyces sp. HUAS 15-9]UXY30440.1 hypothetical protein N8I87_30420 [Streptomyces sp. HUAS 15-9]
MAAAPALGELGDEEQAASALVGGAGAAQAGLGAAGVGDLVDENVVTDQSKLAGGRP